MRYAYSQAGFTRSFYGNKSEAISGASFGSFEFLSAILARIPLLSRTHSQAGTRAIPAGPQHIRAGLAQQLGVASESVGLMA